MPSEAIVAPHEGDFDLLFSDLMMPETDRIQRLNQAKGESFEVAEGGDL